jgi:uncharacterized protein YjbI with pentapeptide repeats
MLVATRQGRGRMLGGRSQEFPSHHTESPALAAKATDLDALRTAVVDAAGVGYGLWFSYLFALLYFAIAAGAVTHRDLLLESPVKLPFLNVELPLKAFFILGPLVFLVVHAYVLLHFLLMAGKVGAFHAELQKQIPGDDEKRAQLRRQLPSNIFVQFLAGPREVRTGIVGFLLKSIATITLVVGPIALLVLFQLQFLPYHSAWITWWQRIAVVLDLVLLWLLWRPIVRGETALLTWDDLARVRVAGWLLVSLLPVLLVFAIATFPGEWLQENIPSGVRLVPTTLEAWQLPSVEAIQKAGSGWATLHELLVAGEVDFATRTPQSLWSNRLVLPGFDAIDHAKLDTEAKIAAATETVSLRARHLEGAVLIGALLRKADFTAAYLERADLTTADLRDANFGCTGRADSPSGLSVSIQPGKRPACTQLQEADLNGAQLQGAKLRGAQLQGAKLTGALLQGVDLRSAQLQGVDFHFALLQGADLGGAELQGADLTEADLQGASLVIAQLQGADLGSALLQGADLSGAELQGADLGVTKVKGLENLGGVHLEGASLRHVFVWRADARRANAKGAWIDMVESEPKRGCGIWLVCDWSDVWWSNFKKGLEHEIPERVLRAEVLKKLDPRLDPAKPLKDEAEMAQRWVELHNSSLTPSAYEGELFNQWQRIGCAADGAPYVLTALIQRLRFHLSPFNYNSPQLARLAAEFFKEDCAGARGLSENTKEILKALSLRVPASADP